MKNLIVLAALFVFQFNTLAIAFEGMLPSTEWQKTALQKDIVNKLERRLDTLIRNKQYIVDVNITTSIPQKPDFKLASPKPILPVKFSNATPDKSNGDYIVFSKFGLEVPLIAAQEEPADNNKKSEMEFIWKYNQSLDVFNNLEDIKIVISLSDKLPKASKSKINDIIKGVDLSLGEIKPDYQINYINFALDPIPEMKKPVEVPKEKTFFEQLQPYGNAIGLLMATLLLGILGFMLLNKYEAIKKTASNLQSPPAPASQKEDPAPPATVNDSDLSNKPENDVVTSGLDRFLAFMEKDPEGTYFLVRKWIKSEGLLEKKALFGLVRILENKTLIKIFENISLQERETWKNLLTAKEVQNLDIKEIDQFISTKVVEEIIVPAIIDDNELLEQIISISDKKSAEFIQGHPDLGVYFIQLLSPKQTGNIFRHLDTKLIRSLLKNVAKSKSDDILKMSNELKEKLRPFSGKMAENSFVKKITDLIPMSPVSKDEVLYDILRDASAADAINNLARRYYPSFLIQKLSSNQLNQILSSYKNDKKAELIFTLDDESKEIFFAALGPDGSTLKEMIKMELDNLNSNEKIARDLMARSGQIWEEFIVHSRKHIEMAYDNESEFQDTLEFWIKSAPARAELSLAV